MVEKNILDVRKKREEELYAQMREAYSDIYSNGRKSVFCFGGKFACLFSSLGYLVQSIERNSDENSGLFLLGSAISAVTYYALNKRNQVYDAKKIEAYTRLDESILEFRHLGSDLS